MFRQFWKFAFLTCVFAGCTMLSNSQPNGAYVPIAGLVCSSPEMVDGNMDTSDLVYIEGGRGGGELKKDKQISTMRLDSPMAHLVAPTTIQLPKRSEVGMIVLYGEHLVEFKVLAKVGEEWKELQRFRNNRRKRVAVTTPVVTDMIRIVAMKDFFSAQKPRPRIQENQVYAKP